MKISQNRYLQFFCIAVILLALVRTIFPSVAESKVDEQGPVLEEQTEQAMPSEQIEQEEVAAAQVEQKDEQTEQNEEATEQPSASEQKEEAVVVKVEDKKPAKASDGLQKPSRFFNADGSVARHRIVSVPSYSDAFPDLQDVQILSANKWGVAPVQNRAEAESRKSELVYVGSNPYFFVEPLRQSIPYLVPRASVLLQDIGRNFFDSLQVKGLPLHKIIVTSVMRSKDDVARLRRGNVNATENSCHMYGTTFDIAYNRYLRVEETDSAYRKDRTASDVRLKQILSEVLNDMRKQGRCWVKYEVKQGCFHATVR
ncbi:MAG: hypothetical protein IKW98_06860 [Prevotella sp.]|nr:hypothetical protein [Prevotella sp.]